MSMSLPETLKLGQVLASSGYFQDARDVGQAVAKILAGRELGIGPLASMTGIYIVKGRVTLSANLIAAQVKRSGRYDFRVKRLDNDGCTVEFYQNGEAIGTSTFTREDAKAAGLGGDNWTKFPKNMLYARAISNGAKWFCPDVFSGPVYTPDEMGVPTDSEGEIIDVTPAEPAQQVTQPEQPAPLVEPNIKQEQVTRIKELVAKLGRTESEVMGQLEISEWIDLTEKKAKRVIGRLEERVAELANTAPAEEDTEG